MDALTFFAQNGTASLAVLFTVVVIWIYVLIINHRVKYLKTLFTRVFIVQYEPVANVSFIISIYCLSLGTTLQNMLERSSIETTARIEQNLLLINLYKEKLLTDLNFDTQNLNNALTIYNAKYKINSDYLNLNPKPEEKLFIEYLLKFCGQEGTLTAHISQDKNNPTPLVVGYTQTDKFWVQYFTQDLKKVAEDMNLVSPKFVKTIFKNINLSIAFGSFFSWLILVCSFAIPAIIFSLLFVLPQFILYLVFYIIITTVRLILP